MDSKITKNYIYNLIQQILLVISPVITIPFLSRSLGADGIGQYSYSYALTNYFTLIATLGCDVYARREISYVKNSKIDRSKKFWTIEIIKICSTVVVIGFYLVFAFFNKNRILLIILTFHIINVPLNITWFYQGIEKFKKITIRSIFLKIAELLFVVFFIHKPADLYLYVFGSSFINFLAFFVLWLDIKEDVELVDFKQLKIVDDFKECLVFFLPSIATSIYTLLDKTMLGFLTGNYVENGYYEQAQKINVILLRVILALGLVLLPQIANSYKNGNFDKVEKFIFRSARYVFFVSIPISIGLICISNNFVPWFYGPGFSKVSNLLKISGFILIVQGLDDVFGMQYLVSIGRQKQYIFSLFIGALTNFLCNLVLIPRLYSTGAVIASFIGESVIVFVQIYFVKDGLNVLKLFQQSFKYIVASFAMLVMIPFVKNMESSIINSIIIMMIGSFIYIFILLLLKEPFAIQLFKKIKKIDLHGKKYKKI